MDLHQFKDPSGPGAFYSVAVYIVFALSFFSNHMTTESNITPGGGSWGALSKPKR
jgi:hypothetical protein